ncbi:MAG: hypothetical protein ACI9CQ_002019 [Saprospiraceae bacterium]|jgi:hypothetical protein
MLTNLKNSTTTKLMNYSKLKTTYLSSFLIFFCFTSWGQTPGFELESTSISGGENIELEITVSNFTEIVSFDFTVDWDESVLTYDTVGGFNLEGFSASNVNPQDTTGKLFVQWNDGNFSTLESMDDGEILFVISFSSSCSETGTTSVGFDPNEITEVANNDNQTFIPILTPGTITFTAELSISNSNMTAISCNGQNDGCALVTPSDGRPPYTYLWSNGGTNSEVCNLTTGNYTCTITDAGNCTIVSSPINITEPAILNICQNAVTDPSCTNGDNGCISIEACGGTTAYSYLWSNGGTTAEVCNLTIGEYSITVTDANDCTTSMSFNLNNPSNPLSLESSNSTHATCTTGGAVDLTIDGGNDPIQYNWSNSDTSQNISDLPIGTYACTITDNAGCSIVTPTFTITLTGNDMTSTNTVNAVDCFGGSNGSIDLSVNGTDTPFTYIWSNDDTTEDISNLSAGPYSCTVTDASGCTIIVSNIMVTEPVTPITINSLNQINILCNGEMTGSISLDIGGGNSPYIYLWSNMATTSGISNLAAGDYSCMISDNKGCTTTTGTVTITEPEFELSISDVITVDVSCAGGSDGSISFSTNGGTGDYNYIWTNGETTTGLPNISNGQYQCTITDDNNCTITSPLFDIGMPDPISITNNTITNASCTGAGAIMLTIDGGNSPYTYEWNGGTTENPLTNASAGNYVCTITDFNGCTFLSPSYDVDLEDSDLAISNSTIIAVSCFEGNNGSISLNISGSLTPFQYNWNVAGSEANLNNLTAGTYTCTVTDNSGCSIVVDELLVSQPQSQLAVASLEQTNVACQGESSGSASVEATGGTSPYGYQWSSGSTEANISNQPVGSYTCTITDANGCSISTSTVMITEPASAVSFNNLAVSDLSCNSSDDGSVSLSGTGGTSPYAYLWNNGAMTSSITNLEEGPYQCTITDNSGCTFVTNSFDVGNPSPINLNSFEVTNASCIADGNISLTVNGGASSYGYLWSNGDTGSSLTANAGSYICTITDAMSCELVTQTFSILLEDSDLNLDAFNAKDINCFGDGDGSISIAVSGTATPFTFNWSNGETSPNISPIPPGSYTCTITDDNGCSIITSPIAIGQPDAPLTINNISSNNLSCANANDGNISLGISGGTVPYTYNWVSGGSMSSLSDLSAGTYSCTITDNNNCTIATVPISISSPSAIQLTDAILIDANCGQSGSGSIDISISGGINPYSYIWNTGASSQDLNNISAGAYICTVTDNTGCTFITEEYTINNTGSDLAVLTGVVSTVSCFGGSNGSITLTVSGTATPFTFSWSNGATTQDISDLPLGTYVCTITDANSCSSTSASIQITQPNMSFSISNNSSTNVRCLGNNDGNITIEASGGTAPFSYLWNTGATNNILTDLSPGSYTCEITDANGCTLSTEEIVLTEPPALTLGNITSVNVICGQGNIGSIGIDVTGGQSPYTYLWSNGAVTQDISSLAAGSYICTVTDNNDCEVISDEIIINDEASDLQIVNEQSGQVSCFGGNNGTIMLEISGSATPFIYNWDNGSTSPNLDNLTTGSYNCTITDANGCSINSSNILITQPNATLSLANSSVSNSSCTADANGNIFIEIQGGTDPYTYVWSNGETTAELSELAIGEYTSTVTDANNCDFVVGPLLIEPSTLMSVAMQNTANASCTVGGFIEIDIEGGNSPYSYEWNSGTSAQNIYNIPAGDYICTITDASGCTFTTSTITIFNDGTDLSWVSTEHQTIICFGSNDGAIDISVSGTAIPFTYNWNNAATTEDIDNLPPGLYSCTVMDASGCSITLPNIAITGPAAPLVEIDAPKNNPICTDDSNGNILLEISGGVIPYEYLWSNGGDANMIDNLGAGDYTCTVTDANGCTFTSSTITLISPPAIQLVSTIVENETDGDDGGSISFSASGGTGQLTYLWTNNETTASISGLTMGDYTCTVTDELGCTMVFDFMIDNIVATAELEDAGFSIFPNPVNQVINLKSSFTISKVRLLDVRGVFYGSFNISNTIGQINVAALANGVYILEVSFENGSKGHQKVVKGE